MIEFGLADEPAFYRFISRVSSLSAHNRAFEHAQQSDGLNDESGFFPGLANYRIYRAFVGFDRPSGRTPHIAITLMDEKYFIVRAIDDRRHGGQQQSRCANLFAQARNVRRDHEVDL